MWYFSWVNGVSFSISFSILNAMWLEEKELEKELADAESAGGPGETGRAGRAGRGI